MFSKKTVLTSLLFIIASVAISPITAQARVRIIHDWFGDFHLEFSNPNFPTQSISHYLHPELHDNVINTWTIKDKINDIGKDAIEDIINRALSKEIELSKTHYVFYHGCKLSFLLFQDILKLLTEMHTQKTLNDFFLLRIPTNTYSRYQSAYEFLEASDYIINDSFDPERQFLLSVNPSLFGNSVYRETSSAFCYFLSSTCAFDINSFSMIEDIFNHYNMIPLYHKSYNQIHKLSDLLTHFEWKKTGLLMQIFIPKELVDTIVYRSKPRGIPFHSRFDTCKPSQELESYQQKSVSFFDQPGKDLDEMQFRILLNDTYMLNTTKQPIKMFRYYNSTPDLLTYEKKFKELKNYIC